MVVFLFYKGTITFSYIFISKPLKALGGGRFMVQENRVLETEVNHLKSQVDKHEDEIEKLKEEISVIKTNAGEMKVYISQIFQMLDDIKTQLAFLRERGDQSQRSNDSQWIDFLKNLLFVVLGGVIAYFFSNF